MSPYQDIWINGRVETRGQRDCERRWDGISHVLARYSRRFSLFDIGAAEGYFGLRAASEFDAVSVMIDGGPQLASVVERAAVPSTIALQHRLSAEDVETLATCERFDVVLALNVLHHFGSEWKRALDAILDLGSDILIETPPPEDTGACGQDCIEPLFLSVEKLGPVLCVSPSHTTPSVNRKIVWVRREPPPITRAYFDAPPSVGLVSPVLRHATPHECRVSFAAKDEPDRDWIPGINLRTYQRLGGVYPGRKEVAETVSRFQLPAEPHGDIAIWNMVFDGDAIHMIDGRDERSIYDDRVRLAAVAQEIAGGVTW